jgi:hypothetical protein
MDSITQHLMHLGKEMGFMNATQEPCKTSKMPTTTSLLKEPTRKMLEAFSQLISALTSLESSTCELCQTWRESGCVLGQGEYQNVFRAMRSLVVETHPWTEPFIRVACAADGVCCFPNYAECPIKPGVFNPDTGLRWDGKTKPADWSIYDADPAPVRPHTREEIQVIWEGTRFEAVPKEMKRATGN